MRVSITVVLHLDTVFPFLCYAVISDPPVDITTVTAVAKTISNIKKVNQVQKFRTKYSSMNLQVPSSLSFSLSQEEKLPLARDMDEVWFSCYKWNCKKKQKTTELKPKTTLKRSS